MDDTLIIVVGDKSIEAVFSSSPDEADAYVELLNSVVADAFNVLTHDPSSTIMLTARGDLT